MKKTRKLAAALGLLALPLFTGAWTAAPQAQQQEEPIKAAVEAVEDNTAVQSIADELIDGFQYVKANHCSAGSSNIKYTFTINQASVMGKDSVSYEFGLNSGPTALVRIKALFFWGNNTIVHGDEVTIGPFAVGSSGYSDTIVCNQGGIPSSSETSNKAWNCNFVVFSVQVKSNSVKTLEPFVLNFYDGSDDTFLTNRLHTNIEMYYNMLTPWGRW